jgi:heme/copper-type cytochrome/quinol oxidase subunit 2
MASKQNRIEDVVEFASTARGRSTVFWAAIAFAVCHVVALSTEQSAANLNGALQPQLIHFGAVLCRFVLPCAVMVTGVFTYIASKFRGSVSSSRLRSP